MTGSDDAGEVLVVRRVLPVERERVFAAWLDPESLATWMRPGRRTPPWWRSIPAWAAASAS